jgi:hypothetical protein
MDEHGKKQIIFIEEIFSEDEKTGLKKSLEYYDVWVDNNMKEVVKNVPGVQHCFENSSTCFHVYIDKRYDPSFVVQEIEAAVIVASGE